MIFARPDGQWFDFPPLQMCALHGEKVLVPNRADLMPLPEGATLTLMPGAPPVGFDAESGEFLSLTENPYKKKAEPIYAVAALLPQGFTRLLLPAAGEAEQPLPLLGYTAVGVDKGKLVVAATATDEHKLWHPRHYNSADLPRLVERRKQEFPQNRIISQLGRCALEYGCFTAQNIFYRRWEGGIPVSPTCNADCLACISLQPADKCASPQSRIDFCPEAGEIAEIAIPHLEQAQQAMISFGQGCEGEPTLSWRVISRAVSDIRSRTPRGLININTNAGHSEAIRELIRAGMDSFRVSLFSPIAREYAAYHQPRDYQFADVLASLAALREAGRPVALNLLAWPGFSDEPARVEALISLIRDYGVRQLQFRNLNCDPRLMRDFCQGGRPLGVRAMIELLRRELPALAIGNYSRA